MYSGNYCKIKQSDKVIIRSNAYNIIVNLAIDKVKQKRKNIAIDFLKIFFKKILISL